MGKEKTLPKLNEKQAGATAKYLRIPPRKARLVIDAVRGKYVSDALAVLKFVPNFAAEAIADVIKSAVANAENGRPHAEDSGRPLPALDTENLRLVRAYVDEGPRIKRLQPRAQGRAYRIVKRMCHITVVVEEVAPKPRPQRQQRPSRRAQQPAGRPATTAAPAKEKAKSAEPESVPVAAAAPAVAPAPEEITAPQAEAAGGAAQMEEKASETDAAESAAPTDQAVESDAHGEPEAEAPRQDAE